MVILIGVAIIILLLWESGSKGPVTIARYAQNAGFSGADLLTAVAIAYAESSGNPNAIGDKDSGGNPTSIGLWQIHFTVHPEFDENSLYDPQYNANAAFQIYQNAGNTFTDWTTFNKGTYLQDQYQNPAQNEVGDLGADNSDNTGDDTEEA